MPPHPNRRHCLICTGEVYDRIGCSQCDFNYCRKCIQESMSDRTFRAKNTNEIQTLYFGMERVCKLCKQASQADAGYYVASKSFLTCKICALGWPRGAEFFNCGRGCIVCSMCHNGWGFNNDVWGMVEPTSSIIDSKNKQTYKPGTEPLGTAAFLNDFLGGALPVTPPKEPTQPSTAPPQTAGGTQPQDSGTEPPSPDSGNVIQTPEPSAPADGAGASRSTDDSDGWSNPIWVMGFAASILLVIAVACCCCCGPKRKTPRNGLVQQNLLPDQTPRPSHMRGRSRKPSGFQGFWPH